MNFFKKVFTEFLKRKGLKYTDQRDVILDIFLKSEKHLTAESLYKLARGKNPQIGYATIYRTLKLLCEIGLARRIDFGDGRKRYEHSYRHKHHDHLVCIKCGKSIEVFDRQIEELQNKLTEEKGFIPVSHQLNIFGICKKCGKRENNKEVKAIRRSLAEIKAGESGKIVEIEDGEKMLKMAESLGIRKDKVVKKISGQFMKGPVIIQIGKTKVGLGFKMAQKIMVEIRKDA